MCKSFKTSFSMTNPFSFLIKYITNKKFYDLYLATSSSKSFAVNLPCF